MHRMEEFILKILPALKCMLDIVIDEAKSSETKVVLRADISTGEEALYFKNEFKNLTSTEWIVFKEKKNLKRWLYHKTWVCHHSSKNKVNNGKRNANCKAKLDILIKRITVNTKKKDAFLRGVSPLPCIIQLSLDHSHDINTASSLRMLRVNEEVRMRFFQYFALDMRPTEAQSYHQQLILEQDLAPELLVKASENPTPRQIQYLYNIWREKNMGYCNPLEKINEKMPLYEQKGVTIKVNNSSPWSILIVTPVMERIHALSQAAEVIYLDSTSSVEINSLTMTVMLTSSKIGAFPIAAFIHESQCTSGYIATMELLKANFPRCFGGKEFPQIFMTDDSAAEKSALKYLWPSSEQLLYQFHIAQAEWRWLHENISEVPLKEKIRLMRLFQSVMYAVDQGSLDTACKNIQKEVITYPEFISRFNKFFQRRHEWISFDRQEMLVCKNCTNNSSEAMMRILKDVVLNRVKAYEVTALVEYCITTWEEILITKLLDSAYGRRNVANKRLVNLSKKMSKFSVSDIQQIEPGIYSVPSSSTENLFYTIDTHLGTCTCKDGVGGLFCKHQCFVAAFFPVLLPNSPKLSTSERHFFAKIALGE